MQHTFGSLFDELQEALDILDQVYLRYEAYNIVPDELKERVDKFLIKFGFEL